MVLITFMSFGAIIVTLSTWLYGRLSREDKQLYVEDLDESMVLWANRINGILDGVPARIGANLVGITRTLSHGRVTFLTVCLSTPPTSYRMNNRFISIYSTDSVLNL